MKLSQYLLPTIKETPSDAHVISHQLMLRAGMVRQLASGLYEWLPLGLKVLNKVEKIVREEMDAIGAQEIKIPCMQPASLWKESGRFADGSEIKDQMLIAKDKTDNELIFSPSAEEAIADLVRNNMRSHKEFPIILYQIQWKFRDEIRPRFGLMRSRELLMKDAYTLDMNQESSLKSYEKIGEAYLNIFSRMGLNPMPVKADSGDMGGDHSHEFHVVANSGESVIFFEKSIKEKIAQRKLSFRDLDKYYVAAEEKHNPDDCPVDEKNLESSKAIEVGHIFYQGQKYTKALNVQIQDENGKMIHPHMGAYGVGVSRLVAACIEASHDDKGIIWNRSIAPFDVILINLHPKDTECAKKADQLYNKMKSDGIDVLYDDTNHGVGYKMSNADLIGIPLQIVIGKNSLESGLMTVKDRATGEKKDLPLESDVKLDLF